ncbi:alpha/beta hydrolase [Lachnoclostridium sp. An14]|uniref:subtype B tannase n=1 Tax=Lachnoclostridium sp. An14 TaxID=1965562 RepID=UPI000B3920FC|nr:subtype B tannase [Lachnoclostridium sp. An14]OUQ21367.1 alpha/beta hydrolase [Lachnoclostridium sp. An14]
MEISLEFDGQGGQIREAEADGRKVRYRSFENIVYVKHPVNPEVQRLNIYVPEGCPEGGKQPPILFPNGVGGYMPSAPVTPGPRPEGGPNAAFEGLLRGYVVVSAGARGRGTKDENGRYTGGAPACIVDQKAAIRYLRHNRGVIPGDTERIISNGTSAGGAISALLGSTGNHPDYEPYLREIGAADERDDVFAASCYCPITDLEHGDMAYEWEFCGRNHWSGRIGEGDLSEEQIRLSDMEKSLFPAYVNSLGLEDEAGHSLTLDRQGNGSFQEWIKKLAEQSAQRAESAGETLPDAPWIIKEPAGTLKLDWDGYIDFRGRMKPVPAFDALDLSTPENELFGMKTGENCHFTAFSAEHGSGEGRLAESRRIHLMNPLSYIGDPQARTADYVRIRHGASDCDTSLAISSILAIRLRMAGKRVDHRLPWGVIHTGDYDLDELFEWIEDVCGQEDQKHTM